MSFEAGDRVHVDLSGHPEPDFAVARVGTVKRSASGQDLVSVELDEPEEGESVILVRSDALRPA